MHEKASTGTRRFKQAQLCEAGAGGTADNDVIDHSNIYLDQQSREPSGQRSIAGTRLTHPGRMVMGKDYRRRVVSKYSLQ